MAQRDATTAEYSSDSRIAVPAPMLELLGEGGRLTGQPPRRLAEDTEVAIGRAVGAEGLNLDDGRASRRHALVRTHMRRVRLVDTSRNGTFVNGQRVADTFLESGDIIRIGDSFLLLHYEPPQPDAEVLTLLGGSAAMRTLRRTIAQLAPTDATVLILGETGTGKEVVARALHDHSGRSGPFVAVNCSAIPDSLAENQLFGHARGAFTGAHQAHKGYFRAAEGGTLFLDELGEMPAAIQPKLLRALEERAVTPVGESRPVPFDARIVAATNADLARAVADRRFRGDLLARLGEISIRTAPVRERRQDILPLLASRLGASCPPLSAQLIEALLLHGWPFNVRELFKVAKELLIRGAGAERLELSMVEERLRPAAPGSDGASPEESQAGAGDGQGADAAVGEADDAREKARKQPPTREAFIALVAETGGNISQMSRALGRSRRQIHRYIAMFDVDMEEYR